MRWVLSLLIAFLIASTRVAAENSPFESREALLAQIAEVTIDQPRRPDGSLQPVIDGDWVVQASERDDSQQVIKLLTTYAPASSKTWSRPFPTPWGTATGHVVLKNGRRLRWMSDVGRLCLRLPKAQWLYLMAPNTQPDPALIEPWSPTTERSPNLEYPTLVHECQVIAKTRQAADNCQRTILEATY